MKLKTVLFALVCVATSFAVAPDAKWVTMAGGSGGNLGTAIAVDRTGNSYLTGYIHGTNAMFGNHTAPNFTGSVMYLAKYDRTGSNVWVTVGGTANAEGRAVAVDESGNVYVAGGFTIFPSSLHTFGPTNLTAVNADAFLAKFNNDGEYQWVRHVRDANSGALELGTSLVLAGTNLYIHGRCSSGVSAGTTTMLTNASLFVALFDLNGNPTRALRFVPRPSIAFNSLQQVAVDTDGNCYAALNFNGNPITGAIFSFGETNVSQVGSLRWRSSARTEWRRLCLRKHVGRSGNLWRATGSRRIRRAANIQR